MTHARTHARTHAHGTRKRGGPASSDRDNSTHAAARRRAARSMPPHVGCRRTCSCSRASRLPRARRASSTVSPRMRMHTWLDRRHICAGTGPAAAASAPGPGSPLPHLRWDRARSCHICAGTGLAAATSAPGPGSPLPHLRRDRAQLLAAALPPASTWLRRAEADELPVPLPDLQGRRALVPRPADPPRGLLRPPPVPLAAAPTPPRAGARARGPRKRGYWSTHGGRTGALRPLAARGPSRRDARSRGGRSACLGGWSFAATRSRAR